jgi:predicted ribosome quality control (RQC) complex YloA/Tae2 family protein
MKTRFNTFDIVCTVTELQKCVGMRVNNVYDIDSKTYLIRLQRSEEKSVILLESGSRIHETAFEWPKNMAPSGFSMKLRKHVKNKRLESLTQLGTDRIIDLQFGSGEAAYHVILELYDKGNIIFTDFELTILNVLRPHTEGDRFKFVVREKYPKNRARESSILTKDQLVNILKGAKNGDQLKKVLVPNLEYGPGVIEHVLLKHGFTSGTKIGKTFSIENDSDRVLCALEEAEKLFANAKTCMSKGYIIQKKEERISNPDTREKEYYYSNQEFHPFLYEQHASAIFKEFPSFNAAVDEFFSSLESQKLELRALQQEREALKKLENVKKDHSQRLIALEKTQEIDKQKAELITRNQELVDKAILAVQTALATQISWPDLADLIKEAASQGDEIAQRIRELKLETNHISLYLTDPYAEDASSSEGETDDKIPPMVVDVDLELSAFANGRRYYDQKRNAAKKQQKTIESQSKAFKSAEKKTKQTLKDVQTITNINKARKVYWFEKFFWFISSENYLVIAGRDQQQNELIVKRYMKPNDVYVHADIHGASSIIIKNPSGQVVPPKTLNEAGTMAICYSVAWEAKVVTNAYWVWGEQVSKTAPTGEYLTTGSFMIRGKKNFLPLSHLILGFSFLFKLEESCVEKHKDERKVVAPGEEDINVNEAEPSKDEEEEVEIPDESDDEETKDEPTNTLDIEKENTKNISSSDDEEDSKFPDTHIKIQHFEGTKINILTEPVITNDEENNSETVVYLGDNNPVVIKPHQRIRGNSESKTKQKQESKSEEKEDFQKQQTKRGQKSKLKKIKEKYKDQDEEERKLRMEILQSAGSGKEPKKNKKNKKSGNSVKTKKTEPKIIKERLPPTQKPENGEDGGGEDEEPVVQDELDMINSLTGVPFAEDELLFAVPVVAPYNTLANYKFKVKLTPGTGRRGKAARTAVNMFLKDRTVTAREKDLLKAVKDEHLARNLPGKVKLSAPKLQTLRK